MQALKAVPRGDLSQEQSLYLASSALVLNDESQALEIYEELASKQVSPERKAQVYEAAARQALGLSMYEQSSRLWREASAATPEVQQSRDYMWQALQVLQASNRAQEALVLAREQEELLGSDPETLRRLIGLARAAGASAEAERYAKQLLSCRCCSNGRACGPVADMSGEADDGAWALHPVLWKAPGWTLQHTAARPRARHRDCRSTTKPMSWATRYSSRTAISRMPGAWPRLPCTRPREYGMARASGPGGRVERRQQVALDNWLAIAQATQREVAWQSVMRLAPGLFDDRALVEGIKHELGRRPGDAALQQALVQAYERQAEPQPAIDYLLAHGNTPQAQILLAQLAERAGQPVVALNAWKRLLAIRRSVPAHVMPAAVLAFLQGERALGLSWLDDAQARVPAGMGAEAETEYWRLAGRYGTKAEPGGPVVGPFGVLEMQDAKARDFDEVINLLIRSDRGEAARVSLRAWHQFHDPRHLSQALYMLEDQDWSHAGQQIDRSWPTPRRPVCCFSSRLFCTPQRFTTSMWDRD
jgi:tetratricopeptide (TPR) repeat protein